MGVSLPRLAASNWQLSRHCNQRDTAATNSAPHFVFFHGSVHFVFFHGSRCYDWRLPWVSRYLDWRHPTGSCLAIATSEILQQQTVHLTSSSSTGLCTSSSSTGLAATTGDFHGCLATSTGGIQLAAVSPFILTASSTCRHTSDTAM
ncbi:hypothetical protein AAZV13_05G058500 [Glycine max]